MTEDLAPHVDRGDWFGCLATVWLFCVSLMFNVL